MTAFDALIFLSVIFGAMFALDWAARKFTDWADMDDDVRDAVDRWRP